MLRLWQKRLTFYVKQSTGGGGGMRQTAYTNSIAKK